MDSTLCVRFPDPTPETWTETRCRGVFHKPRRVPVPMSFLVDNVVAGFFPPSARLRRDKSPSWEAPLRRGERARARRSSAALSTCVLGHARTRAAAAAALVRLSSIVRCHAAHLDDGDLDRVARVVSRSPAVTNASLTMATVSAGVSSRRSSARLERDEVVHQRDDEALARAGRRERVALVAPDRVVREDGPLPSSSTPATR